jgi:hypothetical protein
LLSSPSGKTKLPLLPKENLGNIGGRPSPNLYFSTLYRTLGFSAVMIDSRLTEIALEYVDGSAFELFFRAFGAEVFGTTFIPLGGIHDGGADAFESDPIYAGRPNHFYQASTEQDYVSKIRRTVKRLPLTAN